MPAKKKEHTPLFQRWDMVLVNWTDAGSHDEWTNEDETNFEAVPCTTVGLLYRNTDSELVITNTRDHQNDNVCCTIIIPKGMVHSIEHLTPVREEDYATTAIAK